MAFWKLGSYITLVSGPFHPFGGAIDIVVVQQPDGTFKSSPWYVRFGKFQGVLKSREKAVNISVNGEEADFCMYLDHKGEAFFLHDADTDTEDSETASSGDEREDKMDKIEKTQLHEGQTSNMQGNGSWKVNMDQNIETAKKLDKDENGQFNTGQIVQRGHTEGGENIKVNDGPIMKKTGLRRATILQLMFGRRSRKDKSTAGVERINSLERAEMAADLMEMKWTTNLSMRDRRGHESNSENLGVQDENTVTGEPVDVIVSEGEVKVQLTEAARVGFDLQDSTLPIGEEVDVSMVELDSGNVGNREETLVKADETVDVSMVEEGVKIEASAGGNRHLDWHESLLAKSDTGCKMIELDSSNLEGQDENLVKNCESANLRVVEEAVEVEFTEASTRGLDLHQSAVAVKEEVSLSKVESDSCTLGVQNDTLVKTTESMNARPAGQVVEVPSSEAGNAGLDCHDSLETEGGETDAVVRFGSVHVPSSSDDNKHEVYVREVDADSSNSSGEDPNFVGTLSKEVASDVSQCVMIDKEVAGVISADLNLHVRSLTAAEENAHVFSDCIDAISVHLGKEDAVENGKNGTREINEVLAIDSLELYKQECCDSPGKKNVLQGGVSEANPRLVTVNSYFTDILESCSTTISIETSRDDPLNKALEVSSGDVLPEKMNLALDKQQQNENFQVQKLEITDCPVESSNSDLSSPTAVFDKFGNDINQYVLSEESICAQKSVSLLMNELGSKSLLAPPNSNGHKDEKSIYGFSVSEKPEELQFDFSDDERETVYENKIEITNMITASINENDTPENDVEEADDSDSESFSETNPISIPDTNNTRNESMAWSLPNIQFDKIEQIERLSCSLETDEVKNKKDSLPTAPKGGNKSSSDPNQIKSETGTVHDGTIHDVPDEKSATASPLIGELLFFLPIYLMHLDLSSSIGILLL
jgi:lipin, N-terminal conserved region